MNNPEKAKGKNQELQGWMAFMVHLQINGSTILLYHITPVILNIDHGYSWDYGTPIYLQVYHKCHRLQEWLVLTRSRTNQARH